MTTDRSDTLEEILARIVVILVDQLDSRDRVASVAITSTGPLGANVAETVSLFEKDVRGELEKRHDAGDVEEEGRCAGA